MKITPISIVLATSVALGALVIAAPAEARQQATASVQGVVVDAAGRPVPNMTVTIADGRTGVVEVAMTDDNGRFSQTELKPGGPYTLSAIGENGSEARLTGVEIRPADGQVLRLVLGGGRGQGAPAPRTSSSVTDGVGTLAQNDIVVTGTRSALANSASAERNSREIVSVASSDAIGRFADVNAAEAARRLPGVSVINNRGEGRFVTVRGAEPSFIGFSVNGIGLPSQEDDRSVALDLIPTEQLARVEVYKTLTADLDAEGIGGRVNLVTKSPLDYKNNVVLIDAATGWNEQNRQLPLRGSATISHKLNSDGTLGLLLSGSYARDPRGFESVEAKGWKLGTVNGVKGYFPNDMDYHDRLFTSIKTGFSGELEWRPDATTRLEFGGFYDALNFDESRQRIESKFGTPISAGPVDADGTFTSAVYANHTVLRRMDYVEDDRNTWNIYLKGESSFGPLNMNYRLSYAQARETSFGPEIAMQGTGFTTQVTGLDTLLPVMTADGGADRNNPSLFAYGTSDTRTFDRNDREWSTQTDWTYSLGSDAIKAGVKLLAREKTNDTQHYDQDTFLPGGLTLADPRLLGSPPAQDNLHYDYGGIGVDLDKMLKLLAQPDLFNNLPQGYQDSIISDYRVHENIYAGYLEYKLERGPWSVIPGLRVERTETRTTFPQDSNDGRAVDDPTRYQFVTLRKSYTDLFPSLNVRFNASSRMVLRGAVTRSISRPEFGDLAASRSIDFSDFQDDPTKPIQISEGNPDLHPVYSTNYDLQASWYFAKDSLLSLGLFHKDLEGPIYTQIFNETYDGDPAEVTRPQNADNAWISGVEMAYTQQFTGLPGALAGLGVNANMTLIDSGVHVPGRPDEHFPLFEQSSLLGNASLLYQYAGIDAQFSMNYRGKMLNGLKSAGLDTYSGNYLVLDAKIRYSINKALMVYVTAENLNDAPEQTYAGSVTRLLGNEHYGRNVMFGFELNFGR